jgi:phosphoribosylglycinamide formyltransferase-1
VKVAGATVHLVEEALDAGPIVMQEAVDVRADDTPETLTARILEAEHRIYPRAVRLLLGGRWRLEGRRFIAEEPEPA